MYTNYACLATPPIAEQHRCVAGIESIPRSVAEVRTRELRVEDEEANGTQKPPHASFVNNLRTNTKLGPRYFALILDTGFGLGGGRVAHRILGFGFLGN